VASELIYLQYRITVLRIQIVHKNIQNKITTTSWKVMQCNAVESYRRFEVTCDLHIHDGTLGDEDNRLLRNVYSFYQTTQRHNLDSGRPQSPTRELQIHDVSKGLKKSVLISRPYCQTFFERSPFYCKTHRPSGN
jgi:hypothetical protein